MSCVQWEKANKNNNSIILQYFKGEYRNCQECKTCLETSSTYPVFIDLLILILLNILNSDTIVEDCINGFFTSEILTGYDI